MFVCTTITFFSNLVGDNNRKESSLNVNKCKFFLNQSVVPFNGIKYLKNISLLRNFSIDLSHFILIKSRNIKKQLFSKRIISEKTKLVLNFKKL